VTDDDYWPSWESGGSLYFYDWVNLFFDVNQNLNDGLGAYNGNGHSESYLDITETGYDTPHLNIPPSTAITGGSYAYNITNNTFLLEYYVPFENFTDNTSTVMSKESMLSLTSIGFDVCITDQDEGITTSFQRKVWQNDGSGCGEAWACMDDCGTITLAGEPLISLSETELIFETLYVGATQTKTFNISNLALEPLVITDIVSNSNAYAATYQISTINRNKNTTVEVSFTPSSAGSFDGQLTIYSNAGDTTITLTGNATVPSIKIEVTPDQLETSLFSCSDSTAQQLTISNSGIQDLEYSLSSSHSNSNTPGEVLETIDGFLQYPYGMIMTDNLIYTIGWSTLYVYDIKTVSLINTYSIHTNAFGLASDGQYLYIGKSGGIVYKYNFDGSLIGELMILPFNNFPSLAFNGEHLIAANYNSYNPTVYKCDLNGNIVSTYTSTFNGYLRSMTWNAQHNDGQLWAIDYNNGYIRQLRFEGNQVIHVNSFSRITTYESALAFYANDLWYASNGKIYRLHDGVNEDWLSFDQTTGIVAPGENTTVNVSFDAK
ncbi:MAG: choice-of-anchor D domain-containing protein, partial [Prolixibacteraceae bacterium]|nr:choice-of-anchor D domain-containing protein [Prolixibacteraceae bacterium]